MDAGNPHASNGALAIGGDSIALETGSIDNPMTEGKPHESPGGKGANTPADEAEPQYIRIQGTLFAVKVDGSKTLKELFNEKNSILQGVSEMFSKLGSANANLMATSPPFATQ